MSYEFTAFRDSALLRSLTRAGDALARVDERVARSPIGEGFLERQDFNDAVSSLWVDGELVHIEDLVLHDARMDIRAPTNEIVNAHRILRSRRLIALQPDGWALTDQGIATLRGKPPLETPISNAEPANTGAPPSIADDVEDEAEEDALAHELAEMDALLARSSAALENTFSARPEPGTVTSPSFDREPQEEEDERLSLWRRLIETHADLPPLLQAAVLLDAWNALEVLGRSPWLGRQLVAALLRSNEMTHLPALNTGLRQIARERRRSRHQSERVIAILDGIREAAQLGLKEHDRLLNGKSRMERRLVGRRSNSRLPDLIELVLSKPVVSTSMIVKALGTTPQGAVGLANELELREMTGRGRFRAWGIL